MAERILDAIATLLPGPAALHEPAFEGNEWAYVKECLDTGWVSSAGAFVDRFEDALIDYTGAGSAVATVNGTAALHVCLMLAGVRAGDEVVVPALTFVATANAVAYCGADPHFADCEERTLGLDAAKLDDHLAAVAKATAQGPINKRTGRPIRAVVCVHAFGHPADLDALSAVCRRYGVTLIEDAAESLGSLYEGRHTGNVGLLSALSFNGNKTLTTGGGGAVITNDAALGIAAKHLTTTAKTAHRWESVHDRTGFNYRLPNINAALGCAQMEQLPEYLDAKRRLADLYRSAFEGIAGVRLFSEPDFARSNYWLNLLLLDRARCDQRDRVLTLLNEAGFESRPAWRPLHMLEMYRDCPRMDLSVVEDLYRRIIAIPSSPRLADAILG